MVKKFEYKITPDNYFIKTERTKDYPSFEVLHNGEPADKVDLVFLPEGYTKDEINKFKNDCKKFSEYLFKSSPYKENKDKFNIRGIEASSLEEGTDIPGNIFGKKLYLIPVFILWI